MEHGIKITGRKCYDHLGGQLGSRLFQRFLDLEWIQLDEDKSTVYSITKEGEEGFKALGIDIEKADRRKR